MNILIINGSPRKKGLISQMLGIMQQEAEQRGDKVQTVYTNDLSITAIKEGQAKVPQGNQTIIR